jgi:hypothetical protein
MITMRSRYLTVDLDPSVNAFQARAENKLLVSVSVLESGAAFEPLDKAFGDRSGFFFTNNGYGLSTRPPPGPRSVEFLLYYGPSPKEILEQHQIVAGARELSHLAIPLQIGQLPPEATPLTKLAINSWEALAGLVRSLTESSFSGTLYPAFDIAAADASPAEIKQRVLDWAAILPVVYRTAGRTSIDRSTRTAFTPYLTTYFREAFDRGYPIIRAFPIQFFRDAGSDQHPHEFMLGDEFLVAPVIAGGDRRRLLLPRGRWTDLRTNIEYAGNQQIEIEAPLGRVPMFAKNGSLFPIETSRRMELHYMPSLGGEFFLWEPALKTISQFHAAPAGEYMRVEIETKVSRTYEWVLHHTSQPVEVSEETGPYRKVSARTQLRPGTWFHDTRLNNLHILLRAEANSDRIVNVSFPP